MREFACPAKLETMLSLIMQRRLFVRKVSPGPCRSLLPAPPWAFGAVVAALLFSGVAPSDLRANTTLNSGTTTLSTGRDFGISLYVGKTDAATLIVNAGGRATNEVAYLGYNSNGVGTATVESGGTWDNSSFLVVGNYGTGTLNENG